MDLGIEGSFYPHLRQDLFLLVEGHIQELGKEVKWFKFK